MQLNKQFPRHINPTEMDWMNEWGAEKKHTTKWMHFNVFSHRILLVSSHRHSQLCCCWRFNANTMEMISHQLCMFHVNLRLRQATMSQTAMKEKKVSKRKGKIGKEASGRDEVARRETNMSVCFSLEWEANERNSSLAFHFFRFVDRLQLKRKKRRERKEAEGKIENKSIFFCSFVEKCTHATSSTNSKTASKKTSQWKKNGTKRTQINFVSTHFTISIFIWFQLDSAFISFVLFRTRSTSLNATRKLKRRKMKMEKEKGKPSSISTNWNDFGLFLAHRNAMVDGLVPYWNWQMSDFWCFLLSSNRFQCDMLKSMRAQPINNIRRMVSAKWNEATNSRNDRNAIRPHVHRAYQSNIGGTGCAHIYIHASTRQDDEWRWRRQQRSKKRRWEWQKWKHRRYGNRTTSFRL